MTTFDQNDEHIMQKLQQIVPELRKQIEGNLRDRLNVQLEQKKEKMKEELNRVYQQKIKENIEDSNRNIKHNLANMAQHIEQLKKNIHQTRVKKLSPQEQEELIEVTVDQMIEDQHMLNEVKTRLAPKIEKRVRQDLERELEDGVQLMKKQMITKIHEDRQLWEEERVQYWKQQSEIELNELASEHNQLTNRKQNMDTTLNGKRLEKRQAEERYQLITQNNERIVRLRAELKELKKIR